MSRSLSGTMRRASRVTSAGESVGSTHLLSTLVFAAVCVVTSALGHTLMSGDLLPWWVLGTAFTVTATAGWWLTGRERGAVAVVGVTTVTQGLLHLLFDLAHEMTHGPAGAVGTGSASGMDHLTMSSHSSVALQMNHSGAGMTMAHGGAADTSHVLPMLPAGVQQGPQAMFLTHLFAAVVCGVWLWRGETATYRLGRVLAVVLFAPLRRVGRLLGRSAPASGALADRRPVPDVGPRSPTAFTVLRHVVVRRGPPPYRSAVLRASVGPLFALCS